MNFIMSTGTRTKGFLNLTTCSRCPSQQARTTYTALFETIAATNEQYSHLLQVSHEQYAIKPTPSTLNNPAQPMTVDTLKSYTSHKSQTAVDNSHTFTTASSINSIIQDINSAPEGERRQRSLECTQRFISNLC